MRSKQEEEKQKQRELKQRQKEMKKLLDAKLPLPTAYDNETIIKRKRQELQEQTKQYEESVKQTVKKVEQQRVMLFERVQMEIARKKAEKETEAILRQAGVNVDKINQKMKQRKQGLDPDVEALTRCTNYVYFLT